MKNVKNKIEMEDNQKQYELPNTIQAIINNLITNHREDVLKVLESIPEWNELTSLIEEPDYFFIGEDE